MRVQALRRHAAPVSRARRGSRHWNRTVLQIGVQSGLRNFCAHSFCQQLCDEWSCGNTEHEATQVVLASHQRGNDLPTQLLRLVGALCPMLPALPRFCASERRPRASSSSHAELKLAAHAP